MTSTPTLVLRPATADDSPFLAWAIAAAGRAGFDRGLWEVGLGTSGDELNDVLEWMVLSEVRSHCHFSRFLVAAVDGRAEATLAIYQSADPGIAPLGAVLADAYAGLAFPEHRLGEDLEALGAIERCRPPEEPGCLTVEWVATLPARRRTGLISGLLAEAFAEGRKRRLPRAQLSTFLENLPAIRAYEKAGFRVVDERRDPEFRRIFGSEGMVRMARAL